MRTELLFESCPFLTSANVTLSRLGFADGDALWEIMQDEELYRYEYEAPAKERVQAEYKIQDANAQFAAKRTVTLGVYANTDLAHLIGWDWRCGRGHEHGAAALFVRPPLCWYRIPGRSHGRAVPLPV